MSWNTRMGRLRRVYIAGGGLSALLLLGAVLPVVSSVGATGAWAKSTGTAVCHKAAKPTIDPDGVVRTLDGGITENFSLRCSKGGNVIIEPRIKRVYCYLVGLVAVCDGRKPTYLGIGGALSGTWAKGQTRSMYWNTACDSQFVTGDHNFFALGGDYPQVRWSTDGGQHWSKWVGNSHGLALKECITGPPDSTSTTVIQH